MELLASPPGVASAGAQAEATALVLTALASYGHTPNGTGPFAKAMTKGLTFLLAQQRSSPHSNDFSGNGAAVNAHASATLAVAAIYGLTGQANLREPLRRAVDLILARQDGKSGSWAAAGQDVNLPTTYRQLAALFEAQPVLSEPEWHDAAKKAALYLSKTRPPEGTSLHDLTAVAMHMICQMCVLGQRGDGAWKPVIQLIVNQGPAKDDAVYTYYATQAVFDWEGDSWRTWDQWLRQLRRQQVESQIAEGENAGSWPPGAGRSLDDDRLYRTVLNSMTLQVHTRHMHRYFQFR
ncbi:MAG: hypothetical protein NTY19_04685 [Planctomycetota bacterium]|nr:hypothetical protein [Planctomycetota bacterium]